MSVIKVLNLGQLQTFKHLLQELEINGVKSLTEARRRVENEEKEQHAERVRLGRGKTKPLIHKKDSAVPTKCPDCGNKGLYLPVNHNAKTQVGGGYKSMLFCKKCGYEKYFKESLDSWINRIK